MGRLAPHFLWKFAECYLATNLKSRFQAINLRKDDTQLPQDYRHNILRGSFYPLTAFGVTTQLVTLRLHPMQQHIPWSQYR
jgi:hypothetical protein